MSDWVRQSLGDTVESLREVGLTALASDMERILESGELENLRVFRIKETEVLLNELHESQDIDELTAVMRRIAGKFGVDHLTVHAVDESASMTFEPRVVTTYADAWITRYVTKRYSLIDPVLAAAQQAQSAIYWDEIDSGPPMIRAFFDDAATHGVGPAGFTMPIDIWRNARVAVTITSQRTPAQFRAHFQPLQADFEILAREIIDTFTGLVSHERLADSLPPESLLRVLRGLGRGHTLSELKAEFDLASTEDTARRICEFYEARTLLQAVMICTRLNHLEGLPFERSDIVSDHVVAPDPATLQVISLTPASEEPSRWTDVGGVSDAKTLNRTS